MRCADDYMTCYIIILYVSLLAFRFALSLSTLPPPLIHRVCLPISSVSNASLSLTSWLINCFPYAHGHTSSEVFIGN